MEKRLYLSNRQLAIIKTTLVRYLDDTQRAAEYTAKIKAPRTMQEIYQDEIRRVYELLVVINDALKHGNTRKG